MAVIALPFIGLTLLSKYLIVWAVSVTSPRCSPHCMRSNVTGKRSKQIFRHGVRCLDCGYIAVMEKEDQAERQKEAADW
jgi:hypothetical protein